MRIKDQFAEWQRQEDEKYTKAGVLGYSTLEMEIDRRIEVLADFIDAKLDKLSEEIRK